MNSNGQMQGSGSSFEAFGSNRYGGEGTETGTGTGERSLWRQRTPVRYLLVDFIVIYQKILWLLTI